MTAAAQDQPAPGSTATAGQLHEQTIELAALVGRVLDQNEALKAQNEQLDARLDLVDARLDAGQRRMEAFDAGVAALNEATKTMRQWGDDFNGALRSLELLARGAKPIGIIVGTAVTIAGAIVGLWHLLTGGGAKPPPH